MLSARDLTLRRGPQPLFEQVNFTVFRGNKVGITGANGTGKSSLFAAVLGELAPDRGDIDLPAALKIAHVEQEIAASLAPAIEFVLDGDAELRSVQLAIADAEARDAAMALAELYSSLEAIGGFRAKARAAAIMHGLGFKAADHERAVAEFSGGWRVRLAMARALCSRADLLLLDEPTNHLDLDAIVWLEEWLTAFGGTLLMISHDREFLDSIIDRVLHIENRTIRAYAGNYSEFEQKRAEELAQKSVLHARQVKRVAEITAFVNRFRASATKSRQAQSRLKMLQRMERIVPAHVDSPFEFEFSKPLKTPRPLVTLEDAECGYGGTAILSGINVSIGPLDRIALLGPNGAGKSTLTKLLAGEVARAPGKTHGRSGSLHWLLRATAIGAAQARLRCILASAQSGRAPIMRSAMNKKYAIIWEVSVFKATARSSRSPDSPGGEKARLYAGAAGGAAAQFIAAGRTDQSFGH